MRERASKPIPRIRSMTTFAAVLLFRKKSISFISEGSLLR